MKRIVLTDGSGKWFNATKAKEWEEDTDWDGSNNISCATGSQWDHEILYRTAGGTYVLHHWSQWQGSRPQYKEISAADAAAWLSRNNYDLDGIGVPEIENEFRALEIE